MVYGPGTNSALWRWATGTALAVVGAVLTYAVELRDWKLAQLAAMAGTALLAGGVALLASAFSSSLGDAAKDEPRDRHLRRLCATAAFGLTVILLYSVQYRNWTDGRVLQTLSVGFIAAGATWFTGALLGFLFGIPRTRELRQDGQIASSASGAPTTSTQPSAGSTGSSAASPSEQDGSPKTPPKDDSRYEPGTGLEQIADWLTKIIVGVGLTQLNNIPGKLDRLARYIAEGMNKDNPNLSVGLGICIYFSVGGFLFGFLWARLYMTELFNRADKPPLEGRVEDVEKITNAFLLDRRAKDLVRRQLDLSQTAVDPTVMREAIAKASDGARTEIFDLARDTRKDDDVPEEVKARLVPVLRGLIDADKANLQYRYHSELAYILRDLGQREESLKEFTTAIDIRDRRGKSGWKSYEYERAKAQILLDAMSVVSPPEVKANITKDLRAAWGDPKLQDSIRQNTEIHNWLAKNSMTIEAQISNP